jgi:hypothetical protein
LFWAEGATLAASSISFNTSAGTGSGRKSLTLCLVNIVSMQSITISFEIKCLQGVKCQALLADVREYGDRILTKKLNYLQKKAEK